MPDRARFLEKPRDFAARRAAWLDLLFVDFGVLRLLWKNRTQVGKGAIRMNQPFPADILRAKADGIRTIISARHDKRHGGHALEMEAAAASGIRYIVLDQSPVFSREAPHRLSILETVEIFRSAQQGVLIHCKSGSDRAGFLSALWLIAMENVPVEEARKQLSLRFLHFSGSKTGRLDQVFTCYLAETRESRKPFLDWVREDYDHVRINASHKPRLIGSLIDAVLRRE